MANPNPSPATRFKKGHKLAKGGAKPWKELGQQIRERLEEEIYDADGKVKVDSNGEPVTLKRQILEKLVHDIFKHKDIRAQQYAITKLFEYGYGKAPQEVNLNANVKTSSNVDPDSIDKDAMNQAYMDAMKK